MLTDEFKRSSISFPAIIEVMDHKIFAWGPCYNCNRNVSLPCRIRFEELPNINLFICERCANKFLTHEQRSFLIREISFEGLTEDDI